MTRGRQLLRLVGGVRSHLFDAAGLGLLAVSAFTWCSTAGFAAAGVAVLVLNFRVNEGGE
ncbi:hypothetical protein AB0L59_30220 [Streptomyces sp. NPDC052109]|uniref:hypothetical protein n=1 Tax=Streptomyces sp. NPDC052109 TaxID=3155527 RepID=UPI00343384CE